METTEIVTAPRRLTRPRDGRWLGGVAAGLGAYFDLSPAIYRIAFVALSLAGGTGVLLYLAAWAVIPEDGREESLAAARLRRYRDHPARAIGLAVIALVAVLALSSAHVWPGPGNVWLAAALAFAALVWWQTGTADAGTRRGGRLFPFAVGLLFAIVGSVAVLDLSGTWNVDWRIVLGALVVVTGGLVAAGAATGRAVGAVAALGVALLAALAVAVSVRVPLFAGVGDRIERPVSAAALPERYELGIGQYTVDLTNVAFPAGETHVKATLGIGNLVVRVPHDVRVVADAHASAGQVTAFGQARDGTSTDLTVADGSGARVLVLDARVGLGALVVERR